MKRGAASTPTARAARGDQSGEPLGLIAEAAADVQRPLARLRREQLDRCLAVPGEAAFDQVLEAQEAVEQRPVPGPDRLLVGRVDRRLLLDARHLLAPALELDPPGAPHPAGRAAPGLSRPR